MNEYKLSEALGSVPDDLLLEATKVEKRSPVFRRVLRIAACLALVVGLTMAALGLRPTKDGIVTGSGILTVTAYAADQTPFVTKPSETATPFLCRWSGFVNWAPGCPITLNMEEEGFCFEDITFQVTVNGGGCYIGENGGPSIYPGMSKTMPVQFSVPNNTTIFWSQYYDAATGEYEPFQGAYAYITIIIYENSHIVGYAVLRFHHLTYREVNAEFYEELGVPLDLFSGSFQLEMLASVSFPKVDGEYQSITEEYVDACIMKACST